MPRAVGMFGHSLNPDYFINPPAFTYVIHVLYALRWGTDPASVGGAFAADPTGAFTIARAASAFLGALAVPLTAIAGARLFEDRRVGFVAGALLAVAFLPVHYATSRLNDAPTLAPLALCLVGVAGIYRTGRTREYVLAGVALGVAIATKYTAGIVLVTVVAAAFASPVAHARVRNLAFAVGADVRRVRGRQPVRAAGPPHVLATASASRPRPPARRAASSAWPTPRGWTYYLGTFTWGFGWLPSLLALGGIGGLIARHRRLAIVLAPGADPAVPLPRQPVALLRALDAADLPDPGMLAAWGDRRAGQPLPAARAAAGARRAGARCRGSCSASTTTSCSPSDDTRLVARDWMEQNIPIGTKIVMEPIAPDQWAADVGQAAVRRSAGTGSGNRWNKYPTSRSCFFNGKTASRPPCPVVKLEDYERTTRARR